MRLIAGLVLALAFFSGMAPSIGAQENGLASITIYNSLCPVDYSGSNYYQDCYPNPAPAGREFTLTNTGTSEESTKTTGSDGFLAFEGIDEDGEFLLSSGPGAIVCSEDGNPFPAAGTQNGFLLDLTTDNDIRCDWFTFQFSDGNGLASVTIRKAFCPVGYTGSDYFNDCYGDPGENITFTLTNEDIGFSEEATTGANGLTAFEGIDTDGTYLLGEEIPGDFNDIFVLCSKNGQNFPITDDGNFVTLNLTTDDDIRCDWYNIPEDARGGGSITVYKAACPPGYTGTNYFQDCYNNTEPGIDFNLSLFKSGYSVDGTTDANGFATLPLPADLGGASSVTLSEVPAVEVPKGGDPPFFLYCSKDGVRIDVHYNLIQRDPSTTDIYTASVAAQPGDLINCDWYNLPPSDDGDPGTLTIYKTACPAGYQGSSYFKDCYGNAVKDVTFTATEQQESPGSPNSVSDTTDASGFAVLSLEQGTYGVSESIPGEFIDHWAVFCSRDGVEYDFGISGDRTRILIDIPAGADIRCDWYNVPEDLKGETPTPKPTQVVSQLPSTGAGTDAAGTGTSLPLGIGLVAIAIASLAFGVNRRLRSHRA